MSTLPLRPYPPDWLDDDEAAYLLSLPVSTFRDYVGAGVLPEGTKIGKHRRWSRLSLNDALATMGLPAPQSDIAARLKAIADGQAPKARRHVA